MDMFNKENQKALKEEYKELLKDVWHNDERMIDYCLKKNELLIKTEKGYILEIEKQSIKKDFCFGYRLNSHDTDEYDAANRMANHVQSDADYFYDENMKSFKAYIEEFSDKDNRFFFQNHYYKQTNNVMKSVNCISPVYPEKPDTEFISENDRELILAAYKECAERHSKKIATYLKRFGTSKVRSWSYWEDA